MSRRKDGGFPRRKHGNCNKPLRQVERESGRVVDALGDMHGESSKRPLKEGPPPGLKGKALGMWYRDRQIKRNKKEEEDRMPEVKLPRDRFEEIEQLLFDVGKVKLSENLVNGQFKSDFLKKITGTFENNMKISLSEKKEIGESTVANEMFKALLMKRQKDFKYQDMLKFQEKLPCHKQKKEILDTIEQNQVVVISGETGCGKTTQIAQYVLDDAILQGHGSNCRIICTQPRRISAISVAERVATERNEKLGDSIGYQIRLEKILPHENKPSITFVTTGVLLQWIIGNSTLNGASHVFLDEVHERDVLCDFLMACLKQIIIKRPDLKVILMSATLNAERFSAYFNSAPFISIPGFTYPVEEIYLDQIIEKTGFKFQFREQQQKFSYRNFNRRKEEGSNEFDYVIMPHVRQLESTGSISKETAKQLSNPQSEALNIDLIVAVIRYICLHEGDGAILVFVPGLFDIQKIQNQLVADVFFNNDRFIIIPLHSTLPTVNQRKVFDRPPRGVRKIIIATNIAETSITIDDVVFVVDSGYIKMSNFNMELNVSTLSSQWVSQANARQRRGRAGRVQPGKCYKLYTAAREMIFSHYPLPEIQRKRLEEVVLQVKMLQLGQTAPFLLTLLDPPDPISVDKAVTMLRNLSALDEEENLTPLGFHLAKLPMDPQTGKMILMAALFGCLDPVLSIAASLSFKDPFYSPLGKDEAVRRVKQNLAAGERSDHLVLAAAIKQWEEACQSREGRSFSYHHFLHENTLILLKDMKIQFARHLHEMNFLRTPDPKDPNGNVNSRNVELVKAIVCAGLYPNVAVLKKMKSRGSSAPPVISLRTYDHPRAEIHPRSICWNAPSFQSPFFVYHLIQKSTAIFVHDVTMIGPWALLFFGERFDIVEFDNTHAIRVDDHTKLKCFKKTAMLIQKLRRHLDTILENSISNPNVIDWSENSKTTSLLKAIVKLITAENEEMMALLEEERE